MLTSSLPKVLYGPPQEAWLDGVEVFDVTCITLPCKFILSKYPDSLLRPIKHGHVVYVDQLELVTRGILNWATTLI